jgi:arylformamidase
MGFDWRNVDDETMEAHFNPRLAVPDAMERLAEYQKKAATARTEIRGWYDFRYGPGKLETYDIHAPAIDTLGHPAPLLIFIHGGFWRLLDKSDHSWVAPALVGAGVVVANLNYDLCPDVSLDEIVEEARRAVVHLHGAAAQFSADRDRIFLAGHSAGAHMAAMLLGHDWTADGLPADLIKGAACISGIYEPAAVMRISVNEDVRLDAAMAARNDCLAKPPARPTPILVAVGGDEPEGWRQQSLDYAEACRAVGAETELMVVDGTNHFTVAEAMADPDSALFQALMARIKAA